MEDKIDFKKWVDGKDYAMVEYDGKEYLVPRTRMLPHPVCQVKLERKGVTDPDELVDKCAERDSMFGLSVFHHIFHLAKEKAPMKREPEKVYPIPEDVSFGCVRDHVLKGEDIDKAYKECSPPSKKEGSAMEGTEGGSSPQVVPEEVMKGLKKAIHISRKCEGVRGKDTYQGMVLPRKAICQVYVSELKDRGLSQEEIDRKIREKFRR